MSVPKETDILFDVVTPIGFRVRITRLYWDTVIIVKHPALSGHESEVKTALENPEEVRRSKTDPAVYLFYKSQQIGRWVCAVSKRLDEEGFLITAYPTDTIKEGVKVWPR